MCGEVKCEDRGKVVSFFIFFYFIILYHNFIYVVKKGVAYGNKVAARLCFIAQPFHLNMVREEYLTSSMFVYMYSKVRKK